MLAILGGSMLLLVLLCLVLGARSPSTRRPLGASSPDYGAQAEVEADDIDQMIQARNELRRRNGRPEIGDELAAAFHEQLNERRLDGR